ncbi:MAG: hypothetical protein HY237_10355 [Acidobacteria bacterium]|nr:hypothetical protein [Acidobacteriota bacterium]
MGRFQRTTRKLAQRINLNYFERPHPLRRWRLLLSLALPAAAVLWLGWHGAARDNRVYSSGALSSAHAVLAAECGLCHISRAGVFREHANDQACLACHDGPIHHANQTFTPSCASCHAEHRGPVRLAAISDRNCTQCHANLQARSGPPAYERIIEGFSARHPQIGVLRTGKGDPGTIKLNHMLHMKPIRVGPNGPITQLECEDCHRTPAMNEPWRFAETKPAITPAAAKPDPLAPAPTRALMTPPKYAKTCAACHLLTFDRRFQDNEVVPHDTPEVIHGFLVKKFAAYVAAHPLELRVVREPDRSVTGRPVPASVRVLTPLQWVAERTAEAEELLWRKTCKQCHALHFPSGAALPQVASSNITVRWMPQAVFDHEKHRMMTCVSCHAGADTSQATSDVLLPGIATCRSCHHPGEDAAGARCFECHTYHDWSKEKSVKGRYAFHNLLGVSAARAGEPSQAK